MVEIGRHAALQQQHPAAAAQANMLAHRVQQAMTAAAQANMARAPQLCACGYVYTYATRPAPDFISCCCETRAVSDATASKTDVMIHPWHTP